MFTKDEDDDDTAINPLKRDEIAVSNDAHLNHTDDAGGKGHTLSASSTKKV